MQICSHTTLPSESIARLKAALGLIEEPTIHYGKGISKIAQYEYFQEHGLSAIPWTTSPEAAACWLEQKYVVMCRTKIKGQTGSGIVVVQPGEELPDAKVYTKYLSHKREFRVNLFNNKLVNVREKKKKQKPGNFYVRNVANGYTTAKCSNYPEQIVELAEKASHCIPSHFAGVDIGYNELKDTAFLIEVNSGPSIEGSSVDDFASAIKIYMKEFTNAQS